MSQNCIAITVLKLLYFFEIRSKSWKLFYFFLATLLLRFGLAVSQKSRENWAKSLTSRETLKVRDFSHTSEKSKIFPLLRFYVKWNVLRTLYFFNASDLRILNSDMSRSLCIKTFVLKDRPLQLFLHSSKVRSLHCNFRPYFFVELWKEIASILYKTFHI